MHRSRIPIGILLLIFILTIWNPATLTLLGARLIITSIGVAAGIALWLKRPGALWLAKFALTLFAIEAVARLSSRVDLGSAPPGMRLPLAIFIIVHNGAWYLYLQRSRRVTNAYGLESLSRNDSVRLYP